MKKADTQQIGSSRDWKFGLITREVYRMSNDEFEISDTSNGWLVAYVTLKQLNKLINGSLSLLSIEFK